MRKWIVVSVVGGLMVLGCQREDVPAEAPQAAEVPPKQAQHRPNLPPLHPNNIVSIASNSPDHSTLVAALKAADYVTSVAASGPLTVFAPTNEAFEQLPPGTLDQLLEPENADDLREVLKYHVTTSSLGANSFRDGQKLGMANGAKTTLHVQGEQIQINDATIVASITATNGTVHIIDTVLLPPAK